MKYLNPKNKQIKTNSESFLQNSQRNKGHFMKKAHSRDMNTKPVFQKILKNILDTNDETNKAKNPDEMKTANKVNG